MIKSLCCSCVEWVELEVVSGGMVEMWEDSCLRGALGDVAWQGLK